MLSTCCCCSNRNKCCHPDAANALARLASHGASHANFSDRSWISVGNHKQLVIACEILVYKQEQDDLIQNALRARQTAAEFLKSDEYKELLGEDLEVVAAVSVVDDLSLRSLPLAAECFAEEMAKVKLEQAGFDTLKKAEEAAVKLVAEGASFCLQAALPKQALCTSTRKLCFIYDVKMTKQASVQDGPPILNPMHLSEAIKAAAKARPAGLGANDLILILGGRHTSKPLQSLKNACESAVRVLSLDSEELHIHHAADKQLSFNVDFSWLEPVLVYAVCPSDLSKNVPHRTNKHYPGHTQGGALQTVP
jgi:hypothetical protein